LNRKRLDIALVDLGLFDSRARAASAIKTGHVKVDGKTTSKPSQKVSADSEIDAQQEHPWVSRAGIKLALALEVFEIDVSDRICLDVGSSTGGFTEVLLSSGACQVYSVDVGKDQLHSRLRGHPRITSMEATDARSLTAAMMDPLPDLIVCDASFISATKVLERPMKLVADGSELMTLVKPQFEVGKDNIGRGGLVKTPELARQALENVSKWVDSSGWQVLASEISPIKGGDGNTEFLLYARK